MIDQPAAPSHKLLYWLLGILGVVVIIGGVTWARLRSTTVGSSLPAVTTPAPVATTTTATKTAAVTQASTVLNDAVTTVTKEITDITADTSSANTDDQTPTL